MSMSLAVASGTVPAPAPAPAPARVRRRLRAVLHGGSIAALLAAPLLLHLQLLALKASGIQMTKPDGGGVISALINTLQANWMWLVITGVGFLLALVFGLLMFGWQRAPDHVIRIAGGLAGIIVVAPAILK
jgi:hypothetical protein